MSVQVSPARQNLLRVGYFLTFVFLAFQIWPEIFVADRDSEGLAVLAVCLYGAFSVLCLLGVRNPLAMLPLLVLQVFYKAIWLVAFWLPLQLGGRAGQLNVEGTDVFLPFLLVVVLDLLIIPWPYVMARFVRAGGDRSNEQGSSPLRPSARTRSRPLSLRPSGVKEPSKA